MHFEVLAEDGSGKKFLDFILEKILGKNGGDHSWTIHPHKGLGVLPRNLNRPPNPHHLQLLELLPSRLQAYGNSLPASSAVLVVVDLDDKDCLTFKQELLNELHNCNPQPTTLFRIAIEEIEAWLLGDRAAVKVAYPHAKDSVLNGYVQDSICGTWEVLADAIDPRGSRRLRRANHHERGKTKGQWADQIAPHMDVNQNQSKSFQVFRDGVKNLAGIG